MKKEEKNNHMKRETKRIIKNANGVTLMSLVITIIILLILAGVTLSLTLGDNGIITQAGEAKKAQEIAAIKEDIQLEILDKEMEKGGAGLSQEELEEILGNYGELQEDGNTIKTDEGYEIDIDEIYKPGGGTSNPGSGASDEEIAALEEKIKELEQTVEDLNNTKTELEGTIEDLNGQLEQEQGNNAELQKQIENLQGQVNNLNTTKEQLEDTINSLNTQIADLKAKQATGTAVAADVLSGKTFSNSSSVGITGSMPNLNTNSKITHTSSNGTKVILGDAAYATTNSDGVNRFQIRYNSTPGYLPGNTLIALDYSKVASAIGLTGNKIVAGNTILGVAGTDKGYNNGYNAGVTAADNRVNSNSTNYKTGYNNGYNAGVTAADNRVNTNSTNYKTGYNNGYSAGQSAGRTLKTYSGTVTSSTSKMSMTATNGSAKSLYYATLNLNFTHTIVSIVYQLAGATSGENNYFRISANGEYMRAADNYYIMMSTINSNWSTNTSIKIPTGSLSGKSISYVVYYI